MNGHHRYPKATHPVRKLKPRGGVAEEGQRKTRVSARRAASAIGERQDDDDCSLDRGQETASGGGCGDARKGEEVERVVVVAAEMHDRDRHL